MVAGSGWTEGPRLEVKCPSCPWPCSGVEVCICPKIIGPSWNGLQMDFGSIHFARLAMLGSMQCELKKIPKCWFSTIGILDLKASCYLTVWGKVTASTIEVIDIMCIFYQMTAAFIIFRPLSLQQQFPSPPLGYIIPPLCPWFTSRASIWLCLN